MDRAIFNWINGFAGHPALDNLADAIAEDWVFTGVLQLVFFWFFWFTTPSRPRQRETLLVGLVGIFATIFVARALSRILPFEPRPLVSATMHQPSIPLGAIYFEQASSFPSDTTAYFVAFGVALWFVSRAVGAALVVFAMTVMTLPRIYLGLHFPSDCLAGWLIGLCVPLLVMWGMPHAVAGASVAWSERHPGTFYALLFAVTAEMSNAFRDVRATLHGLAWILRSWRDHPPWGLVATSILVFVIGCTICLFMLARRRRGP